LRVGNPAAAHMRYTSSDGMLAMRQAGNDVITFKSDGTSYFERDMKLGASGGIWQASTGSFASPKSGLKIWNASGEGRLALFDNNGYQVMTLRSDRGLEAATPFGGTSTLISLATSPGGTVIGGLTFTDFPDHYGFDLYMSSHQTGVRTYYTELATGIDIYNSDIKLALNSTDKFLYLTATGSSYPSFYLNRGGIGVGYDPYSLPAIPVGVIALNLGGVSDNPQIVLQDTTDIAHGMTDVASTSTYANFRKMDNDKGGLRINGLSEGDRALDLYGYATNSNSSISAGALAPVMVSSYKKSGTGGTALSGSENIFVVRAGSNARFIVKGNGDFAYDGTGSAYDEHDDVGLLRTLSREMWAGTVDSVWDKFVTANRQNLIDAGIMSDSGFINGAALNRLLTGAIWQLNERLAALEGRAS